MSSNTSTDLTSCFLCTGNPRLTSRVPVYVRVLDVNDNAPTFATNYETFVCENAKANQVRGEQGQFTHRY